MLLFEVGKGLSCSAKGCQVDYEQDAFSLNGLSSALKYVLGIEIANRKSFSFEGYFFQHSARSFYDLFSSNKSFCKKGRSREIFLIS